MKLMKECFVLLILRVAVGVGSDLILEDGTFTFIGEVSQIVQSQWFDIGSTYLQQLEDVNGQLMTQDLKAKLWSKIREETSEDNINQLLAVMGDNQNVKTMTKAIDEETQQLLYLIATSLTTPIFNVNPKCFNDSLEYANGLSSFSLWALQMFDSIGKIPSGIYSSYLDGCELSESICENPLNEFLLRPLKIPTGNTVSIGAVEECLQTAPPNFTSKYVYMKLIPLNGTHDIQQPQNILKNIPRVNWEKSAVAQSLAVILVSISQVTFGRCIPSSCSDNDILSNFAVLLDSFDLTAYPLISLTNDQIINKELPTKTIWFIAILSVLAGLLFIGTLVDIFPKINPYQDLLGPTRTEDSSTLVKLLKCFSIYSNAKKILNTDVPSGGHLGCLNGLRFISMAWIILGHTFMGTLGVASQNPTYIWDYITGQLGVTTETIMNAFPAVDTFFFLSGTLVAYLSFIQLEKKKFNIFMFYIHRYIRLTVPYAFIIGFLATIVPHLSWGLNWSVVEMIEGVCETNGWVNVLYVNNFIKQEETCMGVTWYLANDMQFYFLSPLFILPIWYNAWLGIVWMATVFVGMTFVIGTLVLQNDLPPTHVFPDDLIPSADDAFVMGTEFYVRPYIRFQPYLIGLFFGYILFRTKDTKVKIPHSLNLVLWQVSIVTGFAVVYGTSSTRMDSTFTEAGYSMVESLFYNCFAKIAWTLALCWVVFSCVKGYGGIINSFLSWGFFLPLARTTYMAYLIHYDILTVFFSTMTYSVELSGFLISQYYTGLLVVIYCLAFAASLAFEAPFLGIEKVLLEGGGGGNNQKKENKTSLNPPHGSSPTEEETKATSDKEKEIPTTTEDDSTSDHIKISEHEKEQKQSA